jgi:hypothetical protein
LRQVVRQSAAYLHAAWRGQIEKSLKRLLVSCCTHACLHLKERDYVHISLAGAAEGAADTAARMLVSCSFVLPGRSAGCRQMQRTLLFNVL